MTKIIYGEVQQVTTLTITKLVLLMVRQVINDNDDVLDENEDDYDYS